MRPSVLDGPGACHVDRIVRECIDARLPVEATEIRLLAACDLADVLDGAT